MAKASKPAQDIKTYATEVFGNETVALAWLGRHNAVLGGVPVVVLRQPEGEQQVRRVLSNIAHGISV